MTGKDNYRDGFEEMLRETADRFSMRPSSHVWYSLYNNIHPSRKWPSPGTFLLLLVSLLLISSPSNEVKDYQATGKQRSRNMQETAMIARHDEGKIKPAGKNEIIAKDIRAFNQPEKNGLNMSGGRTKEDNRLLESNAIPSSSRKASADLALLKKALRQMDKGAQLKKTVPGSNKITNPASCFPVIISPAEPDEQSIAVSSAKSEVGHSDGKFGFAFYATPSIGFRGISRNSNTTEEAVANDLPGNDGADPGRRIYMPAFNIEAGGAISYDLSESMRFKAGIQLNYSRLNIAPGNGSDEAPGASSATNIPSGIDFSRSQDDFYSGGMDRRILNNQSYQLSLPLGADVKLADAENIEWFAGASLQPTLILPGSNGMLSEAQKNYTPDVSQLRNWNINGGVETFISYHAGKGIHLNAGPQFRYQILSTYKNQYQLNERLYNVGLKVGISSRF